MKELNSILTNPSLLYSLGGLTLLYTVTIFCVYIYMGVKAWYVYKPAPYVNEETPLVSILVPAYNEEVTIIDAVNSMLKQDYNNFNIVIINDGSKDETLQTVINGYDMKPIQVKNIKFNNRFSSLYTTGVKEVYKTDDEKIFLIDKENGGKSSALNVGAILSNAEWVLCVDADTLLVKNAISETMRKKRDDVDAVSAMIGVVNDNLVTDGDVLNPEIPKGLLARIQWLEYLRSFVLWRTANDEHNCTLVISGAFGLIRREKIIEISGYKKEFLGEDMELTMNIHSNNGRVQFLSEVMAWTEVPENLTDLGKQRVRWYRGGLQSLIKYKSMAFNKDDNKFLGMFMIPFLWFADVLGIWVELFGYGLSAYYVYAGVSVDWWLYLVLFVVIMLFHITSMVIVLWFAYDKLDNKAAPGKWWRIIPVVLCEAFTYHYIHFYWMVKAHISEYMGTNHKWNKFKRTGFKTF